METAKLFQNGQSQAIRLPKKYRFEGREVRVTKVGDGVLLMPIVTSWERLLKSIEMFPEDLEFNREQPEHDEKDLF
jgi:antitoxin VapB